MTSGKMRIYPEADCAVFRFTKDKFGLFQNMHRDFPLLVPTADRALLVDSSETLYQALKFPDDPRRQAEILDAGMQSGPKAAKEKAVVSERGMRGDWKSGGSFQAMRFSTRLKFAQYRDPFLIAFRETEGRQIVEYSRKSQFWGAAPDGHGNLLGENILGRMFMELRQRVENDPDAYLNEVEAPPGHRLLGHDLISWRRTRTLNAHIIGTEHPNAVLVDRQTDFGNPARKSDLGSKEAAISGYLDHLHRNPDLVERIRRELQNKDVICWCVKHDTAGNRHSGACHGDIIRHIAAGNPLPATWDISPARDTTPPAQAGFDF